MDHNDQPLKLFLWPGYLGPSAWIWGSMQDALSSQTSAMQCLM